MGVFEDILSGMGGDAEKAIIAITNKKYKACKTKSHLNLYKMKSGKYKILDYHKKCYGTLNDIDMAKKKFVELYEGTYGRIKYNEITKEYEI